MCLVLFLGCVKIGVAGGVSESQNPNPHAPSSHGNMAGVVVGVMIGLHGAENDVFFRKTGISGHFMPKTRA
jgi:hypothetical protein